jgi:hypothetical protein
MTEARPRLHALLLSLAVALLVAPAALQGQLVEFPVQVAEGAEFLGTVSVTARVETPHDEGFDTADLTARLRVTELRADGSGVVEATIEAMRVRGESGRRGPRAWDSTVDDVDPEDPELVFTASMIGRTFTLPFLPGGELDLAPFIREPETESEFLELGFFLTLAGLLARADGLPTGFPPALRVGESFSVPAQATHGEAGLLRYTLIEVAEDDGRRVARIGISGESSQGMLGTTETTGHILFDLSAGRMVEAVSIATREQRDPQAGSATHTTELRMERVR